MATTILLKDIVNDLNRVIEKINAAIKIEKALDDSKVLKEKQRAQQQIIDLFQALTIHLGMLNKALLQHTAKIDDTIVAAYEEYRSLQKIAQLLQQKLIASGFKTEFDNDKSDKVIKLFGEILEKKLEIGDAPLVSTLAFLAEPKPSVVYNALDNSKYAADFAVLATAEENFSKTPTLLSRARQAFNYALDHDRKNKLEAKVLRNSNIAEALIEIKKPPIFHTAKQAQKTLEPGFWTGLGRRLSGTDLRVRLKTAKDLVNSLSSALLHDEQVFELAAENSIPAIDKVKTKPTPSEDEVQAVLSILLKRQNWFSRMTSAISGRPDYRKLLLNEPNELARFLAGVFSTHAEIVKKLFEDQEIAKALAISELIQEAPAPKDRASIDFINAFNEVKSKANETHAHYDESVLIQDLKKAGLSENDIAFAKAWGALDDNLTSDSIKSWKEFMDRVENAVLEGHFGIITNFKADTSGFWNENNFLKLFVTISEKHPVEYFANADKYRATFLKARNLLSDPSKKEVNESAAEETYQFAMKSVCSWMDFKDSLINLKSPNFAIIEENIKRCPSVFEAATLHAKCWKQESLLELFVEKYNQDPVQYSKNALAYKTAFESAWYELPPHKAKLASWQSMEAVYDKKITSTFISNQTAASKVSKATQVNNADTEVQQDKACFSIR